MGGRQMPNVPASINYLNLSSFQGEDAASKGIREHNSPAALEKTQDFLKSFAPNR